MHRTDTVDYALCLAGQCDMDLDDGLTVTMVARDVMVQQGTNHSWINRGPGPCRIAFILIDGKPIPSGGIQGTGVLPLSPLNPLPDGAAPVLPTQGLDGALGRAAGAAPRVEASGGRAMGGGATAPAAERPARAGGRSSTTTSIWSSVSPRSSRTSRARVSVVNMASKKWLLSMASPTLRAMSRASSKTFDNSMLAG